MSEQGLFGEEARTGHLYAQAMAAVAIDNRFESPTLAERCREEAADALLDGGSADSFSEALAIVEGYIQEGLYAH